MAAQILVIIGSDGGLTPWCQAITWTNVDFSSVIHENMSGWNCNEYVKHFGHDVKLIILSSLQWRHNEHDGVSNHQPHNCLLNCLFRRGPNKTSKLRVTGLCAGNSPGTGEFSTQRASNAENVSIWWPHHPENGQHVDKALMSQNLNVLCIECIIKNWNSICCGWTCIFANMLQPELFEGKKFSLYDFSWLMTWYGPKVF